MRTSNQRLVAVASATIAAVLTVFGVMFACIDRPAKTSPLEEAVARLPLGVSADAADEHMGSAPESVSTASGVLMSPVTMLSPENELAASYGEPQEYSLRRWTREEVSAVVAVDTNGLVAGRWSWRQSDTN